MTRAEITRRYRESHRAELRAAGAAYRLRKGVKPGKYRFPEGNVWAFKKGDRPLSVGRTGYRAAVCVRGHVRDYAAIYKDGSCKACVKIKRTEWQLANRAKYASIQAAYVKRNPGQHAGHTRRNFLKRIQRVPLFGQEGIKEFYKRCPKGYSVDHIIPVNGRLVSGLHVVWNLQYLLLRDNIRKSNKFVYIPVVRQELPLSSANQ